MKITYLGHACFAVESEGFKIILDPFKGVRGFEDINETANMVICSHSHFDHAFIDGVKIENKGSKPFKITDIASYHDDSFGSKRGENTISLIEAEGKRIAHLGDLGHILDENEISKLQNLDLVMIPVGGFYTIDAVTAVTVIEQLKPKAIVPMHYKDGDKGLDVIAELDEFLKLATEKNVNLKLVKAYGESVEI